MYALAFAILAGFAASRVADGGYGGVSGAAELRHSVPRYWAPLFLVAAAAPFVLAMSDARQWMWIPVACVIAVTAVLGAREITTSQPESLTQLRDYQSGWERNVAPWQEIVPVDAVAYTWRYDKIIWAHWEVAMLPTPLDPHRAADSMSRALAEPREVYLVQPGWQGEPRDLLELALLERGLTLRPVYRNQVFKLEPAAEARR
jgi:hypothetical protein